MAKLVLQIMKLLILMRISTITTDLRSVISLVLDLTDFTRQIILNFGCVIGLVYLGGGGVNSMQCLNMATIFPPLQNSKCLKIKDKHMEHLSKLVFAVLYVATRIFIAKQHFTEDKMC